METPTETRSSEPFVVRWRNTSASALLFSGPLGSGKKSTAEEIASSLIGRLESTPDFIRIQPEKNAIKIEAIRTLIQRLSLKPFEKDRIVVMIEDADAMTDGAANALLKTLEEPPDYVLFLLTTTRPERLPLTVRSRCQRISFRVEAEALRTRLGSLLAEWVEELRPLLSGTARGFAAASRLAESVAAQPGRLSSLFDLLRAYWRDLSAMAALGEGAPLLFPEMRLGLDSLLKKKSTESLFEEMDLILETERAIEGNVNKTLALERLFARLIQ